MAGRRNYASLDEALEQGEGVERPFQCGVHGDRNASASVNVDKGVWYCFSCGASGRAERGKGTTLTKEMKQAIASFIEDAKVYHQPAWLDWFDKYGPHPYWVDRFGLLLSREYRLGCHPVTMNPTYPFYDRHGRLRGVVQRTSGQPKYLYPTGVSAARSLFGWDRAVAMAGSGPQSIVVVEGACDVIALRSRLTGTGYLDSMAVVGCYGAGLHVPQVELINALAPEVVLFGFDNDDAGRTAASREYPLEAETAVITWDRKDPGESDADSVCTAVEEALACALDNKKGRMAAQERNKR